MFIRPRPPVPLGALAGRTKTAECDPCKTQVFGRNLDTLDRWSA